MLSSWVSGWLWAHGRHEDCADMIGSSARHVCTVRSATLHSVHVPTHKSVMHEHGCNACSQHRRRYVLACSCTGQGYKRAPAHLCVCMQGFAAQAHGRGCVCHCVGAGAVALPPRAPVAGCLLHARQVGAGRVCVHMCAVCAVCAVCAPHVCAAFMCTCLRVCRVCVRCVCPACMCRVCVRCVCCVCRVCCERPLTYRLMCIMHELMCVNRLTYTMHARMNVLILQTYSRWGCGAVAPAMSCSSASHECLHECI